MAEVIVKNIIKRYGTTEAVSNVSLHVRDKEFVVLVGPSGCGKSTTLRMIAGLEDITSGELYIGDRLVNDIAPKDRDIAMVFQNYALYPHMTVFQNMGFGLRLKKVPKKEIIERVEAAAEIVGLTPYLKRKPGTLSGGQRQRVFIAKALLTKPKLLLLDEPSSALDAQFTLKLFSILKRYQAEGMAIIMITHDLALAKTVSDRIFCLGESDILLLDEPQIEEELAHRHTHMGGVHEHL